MQRHRKRRITDKRHGSGLTYGNTAARICGHPKRQPPSIKRPARTPQTHDTDRGNYSGTKQKNSSHLVFTDHDKGSPRTRVGAVGRHPLFGRRLHRPSGIRRGSDRPPARSRRLPRGRRAAAQLAGRPARLHQVGHAEALLRHYRRVDGFDGQPLHGQPAPSEQRRLYARRQSGVSARLCRNSLHANRQAIVPARPGGGRGNRSLAAAADALRLLERFAQAFGAGRKRRRPADLRHGRTGRTAGRPGTAQRIQCQVAAQTAAGGVHGRQRLRGAARPGEDDPGCTPTRSVRATNGLSGRILRSSRHRAT